MADSGNAQIIAGFSIVFIIGYLIPLYLLIISLVPSSQLPPPPPVNEPPPPLPPPQRRPLDLSIGKNPTVAKIVEALHSRGNYSAMVPDLISKFAAAEVLCRWLNGGNITVFVPRADSLYRFCASERPGVRIVMSKVGRGSFCQCGQRQPYESVLQTCGGGSGSEIRVRSAGREYLKAEVVDWNLYDDGRVVVHGFAGELSHNSPVKAVPGFAISGLIEQRRNPPDSLCRSVPPELVNTCSYVRRVDGRWWD